jgi:hypothetical protein
LTFALPPEQFPDQPLELGGVNIVGEALRRPQEGCLAMQVKC